ncbi:hypothetical protein ACHQM5_027553 [Ranunculus cassubicifolius]
MVNDSVNGNLDGANYSSPIPVIGLYIAAGSFACLVFMIFDIISALRRHQRWIPSRLFSLNSITLTLLSIASKVPVDLTTPMPGVEDQLAKLTGTTFICISMGFLGPSVNRDSEYLSNMAALSILVVTVVVNICLQLSTGVISLFVVEHIVILCCMLMMLLLLWYCAFDIKVDSEASLERNRRLITKIYENTSMFQRLKLCYACAFDSNPQLATCKTLNYFTMAGFCLICFCTFIQATVRSILTKEMFSEGNSDYKWSMWAIVTTQFLTIIVGCYVTSSRWFTFFTRVKFKIHLEGYEGDFANFIIRNNPILGARLLRKVCIQLQNYAWYIILLSRILVLMPAKVLFNVLGGRMHEENEEESVPVKQFKDECPTSIPYPDNWTLQKAVNDINRWLEKSRRDPECLSQLLLRTLPSQPSSTGLVPWRNSYEVSYRLLHTLGANGVYHPDIEGIKVSSLSMALLVKLASFVTPSKLTKSLARSFDEVYEIVRFIETKNNSGDSVIRTKSKLTEAVLVGDGFEIYLPEIIKRSPYGERYHSQPQLSRALVILKELTVVMVRDLIYEDVRAIRDLICKQEFETVEDLYCRIEQIYVDMLHFVLRKFPNAILKEMTESPAEEFEERTKHVLKLLFKIESVEAQIQWSFPTGSFYRSMMTSQVPIRQNQNSTLVEDDVNAQSSLLDIREVGDVILEI